MDKEHVFFENYAKNWDRDRKADDRVLSSFMELAAIRPGSAILDAGCGTGADGQAPNDPDGRAVHGSVSAAG